MLRHSIGHHKTSFKVFQQKSNLELLFSRVSSRKHSRGYRSYSVLLSQNLRNLSCPVYNSHQRSSIPFCLMFAVVSRCFAHRYENIVQVRSLLEGESVDNILENWHSILSDLMQKWDLDRSQASLLKTAPEFPCHVQLAASVRFTLHHSLIIELSLLH